MSDLLMELSQNSTAKSVIKTLGLPVPMPPLLERDKSPSEIRCLANRDIALHSVDVGAQRVILRARCLRQFLQFFLSRIQHFKSLKLLVQLAF